MRIAPPASSLLSQSMVVTRASRSTNNYARPRSSTTKLRPIPPAAVHNLNSLANEHRRRSLQVLHGSCRGDSSNPEIRGRESPRRVSTELRGHETDEAEDDSMQAQFERELEKDAEQWVSGNPGRQELWAKAQARRRYSKSEADDNWGRTIACRTGGNICEVCFCFCVRHIVMILIILSCTLVLSDE